MKYIAIIFTAITMLLTSHVATATEPQMHAAAQSVESATLTTEVQSESSTTKSKKAPKKKATKKKATKKKATKKQTKPKSTNAKKETKSKKTTKKPAKKAKTSKSVSTNATSDVQRADLNSKDSLKVVEPDALGQLVNSGTVDLQAQQTEESVPPAARKGLAIAGVSGLGGLGLMLLLKKFFLH